MIKDIKLLHILDEIRHSGAEVMLKNSAHEFMSKNIELSVLGTGGTIGVYADKLRSAGFKIYHAPFRKTPRFFFEVFMILKKQKFDIVQVHSERAFFWYSLVIRISGIKKIIRVVHNTYRFEGYLRFKRKMQRLICRKLLSVEFVSVSSSVKEVEKEVFNNPTITIRNWIDEQYFVPPRDFEEKINKRKEIGIPYDKIVIISVGSCLEAKNHSDIIRTLYELVKIRNDIFYLHLGTGELEKDEVRLAEELRVYKFITFMGLSDNVRKMLIASDIFVMPSLYEGLGNSCLEAGSCGLPLVIYDSPGLRETAIEGYNGFIVEPNHNALSAALLKLITNEELRISMGKNARKFVLDNFNMVSSVDKWFKLYHS